MPKLNIYRVLETFPKGLSPNSIEFPKGSLVEGYPDATGKYIVVPLEHGITELLAEKLELLGVNAVDYDPLPPISTDDDIVDSTPPTPIAGKSVKDLIDPKGDFVGKVKKLIENAFPFDKKPPASKKYPKLVFKQDIPETPGMPIAVKKGMVIDIAQMPPLIADGMMKYLEDVMGAYGLSLDKPSAIVDIVWPDKPEKKQPPSNLSDAIKAGSEESEQAIGAWFEPKFPGSTTPLSPNPLWFMPTEIKKQQYPAQLYSSFTIMGNDLPIHQKQSLFINGLGQGGTKHHSGGLDQADTNMYIPGMLPLGKKFECHTIHVFSNLPTDNTSVRTFLAGTALSYRSPVQEFILGTLHMYTTPQQQVIQLDPGMDFRFDVQWNKEAQQQFHEEFKDPWWMQYVPADKKTPPRYLTIHVVVKGIMSSVI